jgi:hypothetical protein
MASRLPAAVVATLFGLGAVLPAASAQEPSSQEQPPRPGITRDEDPAWAGSRLHAPFETGNHTTDQGEITVTGRFRFTRDMRLEVTVTLGPTTPLGPGCTHDRPGALPASPQPAEELRVDYAFASPGLPVPCNGRYRVTAVARAHPGGDEQLGDPVATSPELSADLRVAAPPPDVTGLQVTQRADSVVLAWEPLAAPPPDLLGFEIQRAAPDGEPATVASVGAGRRGWTDGSPPRPAVGVTYRVVAVRAGADGADGPPVRSVTPAVASVAAAPERPAAGEDRIGGNAGPVLPPDGPLGRILSRDRAPSYAAPTRPRIPAPLADRIGGRAGTGARSPGPAGPGAATGGPDRAGAGTSEDTGYDETLPYDPEPGERDAVVPPGAEALQYLGDRDDGVALLTPFAVALMLAVWAAHLRYFGRLGRPGG